jgi:pimeloyl-ACP methyl ester carboxylesterase
MLVPGMVSDGASWTPVLEPLAERFTLLMPDPRGAGRTRATGEITLAALAEDMFAVASDAGHARIAVAGHSMGGLVALAMAGEAPDRVSHIVALGASPRPSARVPALFRALLAVRERAGDAAFHAALFPWLFADGFFRDADAVAAAVDAACAYPHAQPIAGMRRQVDALGRLDLKRLPRAAPVPALALMGAEDAMIPPGAAAAAWEMLGAQVAVLDGAGHSLHWDAPQAVAERIVRFVGGRAV